MDYSQEKNEKKKRSMLVYLSATSSHIFQLIIIKFSLLTKGVLVLGEGQHGWLKSGPFSYLGTPANTVKDHQTSNLAKEQQTLKLSPFILFSIFISLRKNFLWRVKKI